MANAAINITLKNKEVAFAILTGKGRKGKKADNEYVLAVECTKKERQKIIDDLTEFFDDNKSAKADKPGYAFEDNFTESKTNKGGFVFWASETVPNGITYKVEQGKGFTMDNFANMGSGSIVDVELRTFYYNNSFGEGLGLRLGAVKLNEFTKYTGGGGSTLEGDTLEADGVQSTSSAAEEGEEDELVTEFREAIEDEDWDEAEDLLEELEDHEDFKKFKKELRKAKK